MSDEPNYNDKKLTGTDRYQIGICLIVGILTAFITWSLATGIGAGLIAAIVVAGLGIGEE
jgi:hypothetical protein